MSEIVHPEESCKIMGAGLEAYQEKDGGLWGAVHQECRELELGDQGIPFQARQKSSLACKGRPLRQTYEPDFVCFGKIILEIKVVAALADEHRSHVHDYLRAAGRRLGLLVNLGHCPKVQSERIVL